MLMPRYAMIYKRCRYYITLPRACRCFALLSVIDMLMICFFLICRCCAPLRHDDAYRAALPLKSQL